MGNPQIGSCPKCHERAMWLNDSCYCSSCDKITHVGDEKREVKKMAKAPKMPMKPKGKGKGCGCK